MKGSEYFLNALYIQHSHLTVSQNVGKGGVLWAKHTEMFLLQPSQCIDTHCVHQHTKRAQISGQINVHDTNKVPLQSCVNIVFHG